MVFIDMVRKADNRYVEILNGQQIIKLTNYYIG